MQRLNLKDRKLFIEHMQSLDVDSLNVSTYSVIYLKKHLQCLTYSVNLAWQILELGVSKSDKPINQITVAEIGGGTGIISLLAKWLGFCQVIYSDTYAQSCKDFECISNALKLKPEFIVCGSINELSEQFTGKIDLIVSRDVIEHIYDIALFFEQSTLNFFGAIMVHNTSANRYNIFKKSYFKKLHTLDEYSGNLNQFKPGDSVESFYKLRLNFIVANFPELTKSEHEQLAKNTRGRIFNDIYEDVKLYTITGIMPQMVLHPTNTCDPTTGNWTENLINFKSYESFFDSGKYKIEWFFSPYDEWRNNGFKGEILKILNVVISHIKFLSCYISPAFIMVAYPNKLRHEHKD